VGAVGALVARTTAAGLMLAFLAPVLAPRPLHPEYPILGTVVPARASLWLRSPRGQA
jgi:Zn-dependent protease